MTSPLLRRIQALSPGSPEAEDQAIRETLQELILYGLSESGFFSVAAFHGGTCLRIVHGLDRFSEDLDFSLVTPASGFDWTVHASVIGKLLEEHGSKGEVVEQERLGAMSRLMVRTEGPEASRLRFPHRPGRLLKIRLEVDTNPPEAAGMELSYLEFPITHPVRCYDLPSGMAGKCHAVLCRDHLKGRDFFDLAWYAGRRVTPNLALLRSLINQAGPWRGQGVNPDGRWLVEALGERIGQVDWDEARRDVMPFLDEKRRRTLSLWGQEYFAGLIAGLGRAMGVE